MVNSFALLSGWGVGLFCLFGLIWLCSDEESDHHPFVGKFAMLCLYTAVISSCIREALVVTS